MFQFDPKLNKLATANRQTGLSTFGAVRDYEPCTERMIFPIIWPSARRSCAL
jgi:hypothetical protein